MKKNSLLYLFILLYSHCLFSQDSYNLVENSGKLPLPETTNNKSERTPYLMRPSSESSWIGATLAYNIEGGDAAENVVGAARVKLGFVKQFEEKPYNLFVIGNLAKITSSASEDASKNITDLIQSNQGLSVGISPIYTFNPNNENNKFRGYSTISYKVNGFKDIGVDKKSITLSQFRGTLGLEFEGLKINNGGYFNLSAEYIYSAVDGTLYEQVFGKKVNSFSTLEFSLIVPLPGIFGFMCIVDYSSESKPIYQLGLVISTTIEKDSEGNY